jgi:hypothetical protein
MTYCLQTAHALQQWTSPAAVGQDNDPAAVVWCGNNSSTRGMALLSRIMDAGGPIHNETSYLLREFDSGRLLLAGDTSLSRELPQVEASDLWVALREALFILTTYNHVPIERFESYLHLAIHNLPIMDTGFLRERDAIYWSTRGNAYADNAVLDPDQQVALLGEVQRHFTNDELDTLGIGHTDALLAGLFSDVGREVVMAPGAGVDGLAPSVDHSVIGDVAAIIAAISQPLNLILDGQTLRHCRYDEAIPMRVPNVVPQTVGNYSDVWATLSGRAAHRIFVVAHPPDAAGVRPPMPGCAIADQDQAPAAGLLAVHIPDLEWWEYTGVAGPGVDVPPLETNYRGYVIRSWLPVAPGNYLPGYVAPPAVLTRFDVNGRQRIGFGPGGLRIIDWRDQAPRAAQYVDEIQAHDTPAAFLAEGGITMLNNALDAVGRTVILLRGLAFLWDAAHLRRTQNDAFGRWVAAHHGGVALTRLTDELHLYLGGVRVMKDVDPSGGLWTLCYTRATERVTDKNLSFPVLAFLQNQQQLASAILKLRTSVEASDQINRFSNSRVVGCLTPAPLDDNFEDRLMRAKMYDLIQCSPDKYLTAQSCLLGSFFNQPHGSTMLSFGVKAVGGMRLREPRVSATFDNAVIQRCNWVVNQILPAHAIVQYYGVCGPVFQLGAIGRSILSNAYFAGTWNEVSDDFEVGAFLHADDEVWMSVLSSTIGTTIDLQSVYLSFGGPSYEVDVSRARTFFSSALDPFEVRLVLPYEHRLRRYLVQVPDANAVRRGSMIDNIVGRQERDNLALCDGIEYDVNGALSYQNIRPAFVGAEWGHLDLHTTQYCSEGLKFGRFDPTRNLHGNRRYRNAHGHFWMTRADTDLQVAGAPSPVLLKWLPALNPLPTAVNVLAGDTAAPTKVGDPSSSDMADPRSATNPAVLNQPASPSIETSPGISMEQFAQMLPSLSDEQQHLILVALLGNKFPAVVGSVSSPGVSSITTPSLGGVSSIGGSNSDGSNPVFKGDVNSGATAATALSTIDESSPS